METFCPIESLRPLQVVTSIGELVEACSPQILSGWRPLFSALRTVHGGKADTKEYLLGEYSMGTRVQSVTKSLRLSPAPSPIPLLSPLPHRKVSGSGL